MSISFSCPYCDRRLKAKDEHAGKRTRCTGCERILEIPLSSDDEPLLELESGSESEYGLAGGPSAPQPGERTMRFGQPIPARPAPAARPAPDEDDDPVFHAVRIPTSSVGRSNPPLAANDPFAESTGTSLREYAYWVLILTLIPLVVSLLGSEEIDIEERIAATIAAAPAGDQARLVAMANDDNVDRDQFLAALPGGKLVGAHLAHDSKVHWLYAGIAAVFYLGLLALAFDADRVNPFYLTLTSLFTGTVGILLLLLFQFCASLRFSRIPIGKAAIIFLILRFIGWSYDSALDPESSFLLSAAGFTFGVGLCEEFCKSMPMLWMLAQNKDGGWRSFCTVGLASGVGFGVSEGIIYSGDMYNGITGPDLYLIRFVSCAGLHAMWAGSVGLSLERDEGVRGAGDMGTMLLYALRAIAIPMTLHGFYDTLLKKDMNGFALLVALCSFGWLAFQIERRRAEESVATDPFA
ncbi:MAG: PrsW family glutamic-type intramembrane protease [Isosphaeraceae bacterium]|nr:PrsW family glutamic-type intramembrane protease [Isosphaeraceae bacterium]